MIFCVGVCKDALGCMLVWLMCVPSEKLRLNLERRRLYVCIHMYNVVWGADPVIHGPIEGIS